MLIFKVLLLATAIFSGTISLAQSNCIGTFLAVNNSSSSIGSPPRAPSEIKTIQFDWDGRKNLEKTEDDIDSSEGEDSFVSSDAESFIKLTLKHRLLTPEEEIKYIKWAQLKAPEDAQLVRMGLEKLIEHNQRLVFNNALRYRNKGLEIVDLVQEGNLGLIKAIEKFDLKRGFRLSTYSVGWIRQHMDRAIMNKALSVRLPAHFILKLRMIYNMEEYLSRIKQKIITYEEISQAFQEGLYESVKQKINSFVEQEKDDPEMQEDLTLEKQMEEESSESFNATKYETFTPKFIEMAYIKSNMALSESYFDSLELDGKHTSIFDRIEGGNHSEGEAIAISSSLKNRVETLLLKLSKKERLVIRYRYGLGLEKSYTLDEIGSILGVTRERVRQIQVKASRKLQHSTDFINLYRENQN